jgi:transcriptional regulator of acetoin/glycerol metabolism
MPFQFQARLLRVLQERSVSPLGGSESYQVDFALVCATNRRMRHEVESGRFREDLYYRLNGMLITLPRLSQRLDRLELARSIIRSLAPFGRDVSLDSEVTHIFEKHAWPGNIRQMHSVLRTSVALLGYDNEITVEHLPEDFLEQSMPGDHLPARMESSRMASLRASDGTSLGQLEKTAIHNAVRECRGNIAAAARRLGISRNTLYRKIQVSA